MTREALAKACEYVASGLRPYSAERHALALAAAAELRKTCATCQDFQRVFKEGVCKAEQVYRTVPADGSGYCHRWEGKP